MKKFERVAAVSVAASSKRESDALKDRNAGLDSKATRLHNEVGDVMQLCMEVTR